MYVIQDNSIFRISNSNWGKFVRAKLNTSAMEDINIMDFGGNPIGRVHANLDRMTQFSYQYEADNHGLTFN